MKLLTFVNRLEPVELPAVEVLISRAEIDLLMEELKHFRGAPNHDGGAQFHFELGFPNNDNELTFGLAPGETRG